MLRKYSLVLILLLLFSLTIPTYANGEYDMAANSSGITDHLETSEDINSYSFELAEAGDGVIIVTVEGNYSTMSYWFLSVKNADDGTEMDSTYVKDGKAPTVLPLRGLSAGRYTVEVSATSNFSAKDYTLAIHTSDSNELQNSHKGDVRKMADAGLICKIDGHSFVKTNRGEAYAALYRNPEGAITPILISKDKDAVEYVCLTTGDIVVASAVNVSGENYYFSNADWLDKYTAKLFYQDYKEGELFFTDDQHSAYHSVEKVLDRVEWQEKGAVFYILTHYWWLLAIFAVVGAIVFIWFKGNGSDDSSDDSSDYYGDGSSAPRPDDSSDAYGRAYGAGGPVDVDGI